MYRNAFYVVFLTTSECGFNERITNCFGRTLIPDVNGVKASTLSQIVVMKARGNKYYTDTGSERLTVRLIPVW